MSIALDIGTSRLRSLRCAAGEVLARSIPNTCLRLGDSPATRALLTRAGLRFATGHSEAILFGQDALDYAGALRTTPERLFPVLSEAGPAYHDFSNGESITALLESLLPPADPRGQICGLVVPPAMTDPAGRTWLSQAVAARGYTPSELSAPFALILATRSLKGSTGIGIVLGAGGCSVSLIDRGREVVAVHRERGTDWMDRELARGGPAPIEIQARREALTQREGASEFALGVRDLYQEILEGILGVFVTRLDEENVRIPPLRALSLVCGGGGRGVGFREALDAALQRNDLPLPSEAISTAPADDYLIARGALIHAEIEATINAAA